MSADCLFSGAERLCDDNDNAVHYDHGGHSDHCEEVRAHQVSHSLRHNCSSKFLPSEQARSQDFVCEGAPDFLGGHCIRKMRNPMIVGTV